MYTVRVRDGSKTSRSQYELLEDALVFCEAEAKRMAQEAPNRPVETGMRKFDPVDLVAGRVELSTGSWLRRSARSAGLDIRGDGSIEAYSGRISRSVVVFRVGETTFDALRRAIAGDL
ncbi:MAG: hypothetical protein JHC87_04395 [Thermoleophilaceae bacterium]|nr:hypothetical protein [Thermoleophilaceae bacterium]